MFFGESIERCEAQQRNLTAQHNFKISAQLTLNLKDFWFICISLVLAFVIAF